MIGKRTAPLLGAVALASLAALALSGCGKQGELERPAPLIGRAAQPNAQTRARQQAEARAREDAKGTSSAQAPQSVDEVRNEGAELPSPPLKGSTIPGTPPPPNSQPPPGGLPNPLQPSTVPQ